jgi:hypothetical protein
VFLYSTSTHTPGYIANETDKFEIISKNTEFDAELESVEKVAKKFTRGKVER